MPLNHTIKVDEDRVLCVFKSNSSDEDAVACLQLFTNVKNCGQLKALVIDGTLQASLIRPQVLGGVTCVLSACSSAVGARNKGRLNTRSIFTEVLFNLAPHNKIASALQQFGAQDRDESVLVVTIDKYSEDLFNETACEYSLPNAEKIFSAVKGDRVSVDYLQTLIDEAAVRKIYKIAAEEVQAFDSLEDSCLFRMACSKRI